MAPITYHHSRPTFMSSYFSRSQALVCHLCAIRTMMNIVGWLFAGNLRKIPTQTQSQPAICRIFRRRPVGRMVSLTNCTSIRTAIRFYTQPTQPTRKQARTTLSCSFGLSQAVHVFVRRGLRNAQCPLHRHFRCHCCVVLEHLLPHYRTTQQMLCRQRCLRSNNRMKIHLIPQSDSRRV